MKGKKVTEINYVPRAPMPPNQLVEDILKKEQRIIKIIAEIKQVLSREPKA